MNNMNMNSNSFVTPPEHIVHEHGSSNQVNINNNILPSRSNPTRTIPVDFTSEQQGGQPTKRRKSSAAFVMPPHQPDPFMQSQAQYYVQPQPQSQPVYVPYPQSFQMRQPMSMSSSRNTNANSRSSHVMGYPDNINTQVVLQNPDQIMSSQNNQHVQSQMVSPPIGFTSQMNQIQLSNQQQQHQQQQLSQQLLHGNNQGQMQQINLNMDLYRSSQIGNVFYPSMQQAELYLGDLSTPTPTPTHTPLPTPTPMLSQDYILQRLDTIKSEITKKDYQTLCAELLKYLQTDIAYSSPQCQESFYQCLQNIKSNFGSTPMEIGLSVFQAALNNIHRFSNTQHQNHIKKWANELNKSSSVTSQQFPANNINPSLVRPVARQQQQQQQPPPPPPQQQQHHQQQINQPRIENKQISDVEKANGNWVSRIIDRAWGHVMLPYESLIANQHQEQQEFVNSFYIPHEKFERIWKLETASPATLIHPNKLPLTYRLISRKPNNIDDDNKCDWPPEEAMFKVQINDSEVKLHRKQRIPIKNNQYSFVGVDKAVDIAQYLEAGVNRIKITQCMCETCRQQLCEHILSIEILLKETEEIVLRNARSQTLTVEHGMEIVKRLISGPSASIINAQSPTSSISSPSHTMITDEDDCDVTVNKMKVSLRCPISLLRIAEPAKGQHCLHIGCFDLETYVSVNKKNSKWRCPECNDRVTSETLRIDEYFKRLLEQIPENVNTVELDSSGRWTVVGQDDCDGESTDDDDMQVDSASKKSSISSQKAPNTIIILDDDDDDELEPQPINNQQQVLSMQNNNMPTYDQSSTIIRQTSTPYTQPVRNDQSQLTNSIIIQSPPHSASLTTPSIPKNYLPQLPLSQLSADHTTYVEAIPPFYNNSNKSKRKSNSKKRRSRRKDMEVNTQDRGNSSTKDDHNNNEDNSNSKSNWLQVAGIQTLLLSPQDSVTKTATQVASPISPPISVTVPNHSQSEEWETEDEQEEVVLVSSTTV